MYKRNVAQKLTEALLQAPAVVLLGPRQTGKTTLALEAAQQNQGVYLDLQSPRDRAKLKEPELFFEDHFGKLVILDEIHHVPGLFPILRGMIDRQRRQGFKVGQYLLLGSASLDVLKQSGETLAGRVRYLELSPLNITEVTDIEPNIVWLQGGFPESLLSTTSAHSLQWREDFIRTYLERDIAQFAPRVSPQILRSFWTMLAHHQATLLNVAQLARNLSVDTKTANSYINILCDLLLVRRLQPWHGNLGKRLVKTPKTYIRDTGLMHALLSIQTNDALAGHPTVGASWEAFCIETISQQLPSTVQTHFYRTSAGAEIDLLIQSSSGNLWAVEMKRSLTPKVERGFHHACADLNPTRKFVVYPGTDTYRMSDDMTAIPLLSFCKELETLH
jgi:uncharacterized protein